MGIISPFFPRKLWCPTCICSSKEMTSLLLPFFHFLPSLASAMPCHRMIMMILGFSCIAYPTRHWLNHIWRKRHFEMWWTVDNVVHSCYYCNGESIFWLGLSFSQSEFFAWEHISSTAAWPFKRIPESFLGPLPLSLAKPLMSWRRGRRRGLQYLKQVRNTAVVIVAVIAL